MDPDLYRGISKTETEMALKRKFIFSVAVLSLIVAVLTIIWLVAFWQGLSAAQESLFVHIVRQRFAGIFVAAFFSLCAVALLVGAVLHYYLIPLKRLVEETNLMTTVNPSHRIRMEGAGDILRVAQAVNEGAERFQQLQDTIREKTKASKQRETEESNILAAMISRMSEGILLCNNDGVILLYNDRARQLLAPNGEGGGSPPGFVGLGRSMMNIVDSRELGNAFEELNRQHALGNRNPVYSLAIGGKGDREVRLRIALMVSSHTPNPGFLLTCYEMPREDSPVLSGVESAVTLDDGAEISQTLGMSEPFAVADEGPLSDRPYADHPTRPEFYDFDLFQQRAKNPLMEKRALSDFNYTVFDTETTGLDPVGGDEIIAIGAVRIINGRILYGETFDQLVDPQWFMRPEVVRIHGITPEMLKGQPTIDTVLPFFQGFVGDDTVLVGHNCAFDMRFLQLKEEKTGVRFLNPVLDTLLLSEVVHPNQESHTFEAIAERMGIRVVGRHSALGDAILTAKIFKRLIPLLKKKGVTTLGEAMTASRRTYFARLKY
ncbi:MAG: hypothetical protein JRK53_01310 [Deltaproteobacteria bacterium]|nr:hypothetical protein [Deltaproteobacteria bacterium]